MQLLILCSSSVSLSTAWILLSRDAEVLKTEGEGEREKRRLELGEGSVIIVSSFTFLLLVFLPLPTPRLNLGTLLAPYLASRHFFLLFFSLSPLLLDLSLFPVRPGNL